jgi:hypothetical protein
METLKAQDLYDRSLIVVVADHGINFDVDILNRILSKDNVGSVGFVPLLIKYPFQNEGTVDRTNVQTIDIVPTIVDVLGMEGVYEMDGRSLIDPTAQIPDMKRFHNLDDVIFEYGESNYTAARKKEHEDFVARFSLEHPKATLYHHGPGLDWIGETQAVLAKNALPGTITCPGIDALKTVDLSSNYIPVLLSGSVVPDQSMPIDQQIVVACVNGIAHGIAGVFETEEGLGFELVLSDQIFQEGNNDVELFLLPLP